jgi:hypothetical protein
VIGCLFYLPIALLRLFLSLISSIAYALSSGRRRRRRQHARSPSRAPVRSPKGHPLIRNASADVTGPWYRRPWPLVCLIGSVLLVIAIIGAVSGSPAPRQPHPNIGDTNTYYSNTPHTIAEPSAPTTSTTVVPVTNTTAPTTPAPIPTTTLPRAAASECSPLSDEGTCYEPGEYCRDDDHGATGTAGDGESIICEDNDGWRWEPA